MLPRVRRGGFATDEAAREAMARVRNREGCDGELTVGEWLTSWLAGHTRLAASTRVSYAEHIAVYINPAIGAVPLAELSTRQLADFYTALARRHTRQRQGGAADAGHGEGHAPPPQWVTEH
jgi:hypothetical protein